jgi:hypothetical protein
MLGGRNKIDTEFLRVKVVDAVHMLNQVKSFSELTKVGGGSPGQNLTLRKKTSLVCLPRSFLTE